MLAKAPVLLCLSKFNSSVSFSSSTVNPNGAKASMPCVLTAEAKRPICCAPCVELPKSAANPSEFSPTSLAKSSNGNAACAALCLSATILCPKLAPTCDSCLNVSILVSSLLPSPAITAPNSLTLNASVNEEIVPVPCSAAENRPPNTFVTLDAFS